MTEQELIDEAAALAPKMSDCYDRIAAIENELAPLEKRSAEISAALRVFLTARLAAEDSLPDNESRSTQHRVDRRV